MQQIRLPQVWHTAGGGSGRLPTDGVRAAVFLVDDTDLNPLRRTQTTSGRCAHPCPLAATNMSGPLRFDDQGEASIPGAGKHSQRGRRLCALHQRGQHQGAFMPPSASVLAPTPDHGTSFNPDHPKGQVNDTSCADARGRQTRRGRRRRRDADFRQVATGRAEIWMWRRDLWTGRAEKRYRVILDRGERDVDGKLCAVAFEAKNYLKDVAQLTSPGSCRSIIVMRRILNAAMGADVLGVRVGRARHSGDVE